MNWLLRLTTNQKMMGSNLDIHIEMFLKTWNGLQLALWGQLDGWPNEQYGIINFLKLNILDGA